MQSSKRTLRSHEITVPLSVQHNHTQTSIAPNATQSAAAAAAAGYNTTGNPFLLCSSHGQHTNASSTSAQMANSSGITSVGGSGGGTDGRIGLSATNSCGAFGSLSASGGNSAAAMASAAAGGGGAGSANSGIGAIGGSSSGGGGGVGGGGAGVGSVQPALLETDLDLHFSLQYPHFIKRDGNRSVCFVLAVFRTRSDRSELITANIDSYKHIHIWNSECTENKCVTS